MPKAIFHGFLQVIGHGVNSNYQAAHLRVALGERDSGGGLDMRVSLHESGIAILIGKYRSFICDRILKTEY